MMTKDYGSVRFEGETILLIEDARYSEHDTNSEIGWFADGITADRCVTVHWMHPADIEDPDDMDWDNVDRVEDRDDPNDIDPATVVGREIASGQAHWIATYALHVARGGHDGPQTLRKLMDLHDDMLDSDPVAIVEEFHRRGKADKNIDGSYFG